MFVSMFLPAKTDGHGIIARKEKKKNNPYQVGQVSVLQVLMTLLQDLCFEMTDSIPLTTHNWERLLN